MEIQKLLMGYFIGYVETILLRNRNNRIVLTIFSLLKNLQRTLRTSIKAKQDDSKFL